MPAQYDTIQGPYDQLRKGSIALIERRNVHEVVKPFINGARVLDLACGSGFYTLELLDWGAASVLGVDISSTMLAEARRRVAATATAASHLSPDDNNNNKNNDNNIPPTTNSAITFLQADCTNPVPELEQQAQQQPFDLVFAAWLLNYAATRTQLTQMFHTAARSLKDDGGVFVAVTPVPSDDPVAFHAAERRARPAGAQCLLCEPRGDVAGGGGVAIHVHGETAVGPVDFDDFHFQREVYEAAARAGGFGGALRWRVTAVPDGFFQSHEGGASQEELESYIDTPHYGILEIMK
ncbi:unnamed protein product [Discula destructiva]